MAPQPHTLWSRVLQELQQLPTLEGQAQLACARKLMESAQAFGDLEFVPRAAWKQLIQELQVPKHLGEACCTFQADIDSGTGASSSSGGRSGGSGGAVTSDTRLCRRTVWAAMLSFLTRAAKDLLPDSSGLMGPGLSNLQNNSSNKQLVRTVTDQLQQFLGQIPDMYRAMAQHLQAASESAAAAPRQPAASYPPEYELYTYAATLSCAPMISSFQPTQAASVGMFREAAGLVVAGMRYMTTALPLTLGAERTTMCMQVVEPLPPIFSNVVCLVASPGLAAAGGKQLLESPDVRTLLSLMVFAVYASTFIPQTHASSRSRKRRAGRLQGPEQAAEAVHAAAVAAAAAMQQEWSQFGWACGAAALGQPQQQQLLPPPPPPPQQQQQQGDVSLQTTGVSMEAVAWYAAHTYSNPHAHNQLHALSVLFAANVVRKVMGHHWCSPVGKQQPQQQQQEEEQGRSDVLRQMRQFGTSPEAVRARAHRCLLLAQVLLSAADRQRNSATFAADCGASLSIARLCLEHAVACYADLQEAPQGYSVLCAWWKPVLPLLLRLMQYVLQQLQAGDPGVHVAAAITDTSGSIKRQLPGAAAMTAALQSGLAGLVSPLFRLLGAGSQHVGTLGCDESAPLSHAAAALVPSISNTTGNTALWQDNSVQLCTAVEGLLRMQAHGAVMSASRAHGMLDDLQRLQATRGVVYELGSKVLNCAHPLVAAAGSTLPGSKQQLQLFSLMCSYLKLCDYITPLDAHAAKWGYWRATTMTGAMLEDISSRGLDSEPGKAAAAAGTPVAHEQPTAASAAAAAVQSEGGPAGTAVEGLPWLVLVGRCCLQSAATLRQVQASTPNLGQHLMQQPQRSAAAVLRQQREAEAVGAEGPSVGSYYDGVLASEHAAVLRMSLTCSGEWLGQAGTAAELAAAGYPAESALQQVQAVVTRLNAGLPADAESAVRVHSELTAQLQSLGLVLTSLAVPHACNNPACSNMAGPTELAAVSGRSCMCAGCLTARYCSRVCQKQHWKQHKPVCKALAAAAAAAAAGAAGGS